MNIVACIVGFSALATAFAAPPAETAHAERARRLDRADVPAVRAIRHHAHRLRGRDTDYDHLVAAIGDARIVLLGEDTHGSREHYVERARITRRLIGEHGFAGIVIEADWPSTSKVGAAIERSGADSELDQGLRAFDRFPLWMWRNLEFRALLVWLRTFNARDARGRPAVLRGMDLYELEQAATVVTGFLERANPTAANIARERYGCFAPAAMDPQRYGAILSDTNRADCRGPVQDQLAELATRNILTDVPGVDDADTDYFDALQSARAIRNAEEYFRALHGTPETSWNLRDAHMAASIDHLLSHLDLASGRQSRIVVWAHNSHIGDARATARGETGGWTLGQLLRERYPGRVYAVGFTTATGYVHAATNWGEPGRPQRIRTPLRGSHAALMHASGLPRFYLTFGDSPDLRRLLAPARAQRGIGVRYLPALEIAGHYYMARLPEQFDALVHIDRTTPLHPDIRR